MLSVTAILLSNSSPRERCFPGLDMGERISVSHHIFLGNIEPCEGKQCIQTGRLILYAKLTLLRCIGLKGVLLLPVPVTGRNEVEKPTHGATPLSKL